MMPIDFARAPALQVRAAVARVRALLHRMRPSVWRTRSARSVFYARVWQDAAAEVGAEVCRLKSKALEIRRGEARVTVRSAYTPLDDAITLKRAGDKPHVHETLKAHGLPTPAYRRFSRSSLEQAQDFLERRGHHPCVVKPARGTGAGQGITTGITTRAQLERAAATAARYGRELIIERQVAGDNYRLLYLDGRLLDAVKRQPPTVTGDGRHTLRQLVRAENRRRLRLGWTVAQTLIACDPDMRLTLARQGLSLAAIPAAGRHVVLKTVINDNSADETAPATTEICDAVVAAGAAAARAVGVRLAGVDVVAADVSRPLSETGGVILEVNTTPGLYHHKRGDRCPVAAQLVRLMLDEAAPAVLGPAARSPSLGSGRVPDTLPPAVVIGGGANALSIARRLGGRGVRVYAVNKPATVVGFSRFAERLPAPTPDDYSAAWAAYLTGPQSEWLRGAVLLAASDVGLEIIANHREALAQRFRLDLSNPEAQGQMLDKLTTYRAAAEAGVPAPRFWEAGALEDLHAVRDELVYPVLVKPKLSHTFTDRFKGKYLLAEDFGELVAHGRTLLKANVPFVVVEKIPGADDRLCSYYTYLDERGEPQFHFTKRIIRRFPAGMGLACYHVTDWNPEVRDAALRLFRHVGLRGLATAEFLRDERDGVLKLIECNARFTEADPLVASSGFDLPSFVYNRIVGLPQGPYRTYRMGLYLWRPFNDFRAYCERTRRGELTLRQWLFSLRVPFVAALFRWDDPLPSAGPFMRKLWKLCHRWSQAWDRKIKYLQDLEDVQ